MRKIGKVYQVNNSSTFCGKAIGFEGFKSYSSFLELKKFHHYISGITNKYYDF